MWPWGWGDSGKHGRVKVWLTHICASGCCCLICSTSHYKNAAFQNSITEASWGHCISCLQLSASSNSFSAPGGRKFLPSQLQSSFKWALTWILTWDVYLNCSPTYFPHTRSAWDSLPLPLLSAYTLKLGLKYWQTGKGLTFVSERVSQLADPTPSHCPLYLGGSGLIYTRLCVVQWTS